MKHITPPPPEFCFVMSRLRDMSKIALMLSFVSVVLLGCGGGGGGSTNPMMNNGGGNPSGNDDSMMIDDTPMEMIDDPVTPTFAPGETPDMAERTGGTGDDVFTITGVTTGDSPTLTLGVIDGMAGDDTFQVDAGGIVGDITFSSDTPTGGGVNLQNIEIITINGGTVEEIDASASEGPVTINLQAGENGSHITGSPFDDRFFLIPSGIENADYLVGGYLDGGEGTDTLFYAGGAGRGNFFNDRNALTIDTDITDEGGSIRNFESQMDPPMSSGLGGLTVSGIEVLALSPALNLYGALSDALMQFG